MGIRVKALVKVKRGTFDLMPGRVYELDEMEAARLIKAGQAVVERAAAVETAVKPPLAEKMIRRVARRTSDAGD